VMLDITKKYRRIAFHWPLSGTSYCKLADR
jgi:hypothetical protein